MLRSGALSRILTFLDSPLDLTVTNACAAIRSLCLCHKETQDTLREAGVLPKLIALLARAGLSATKRNPAVAEYACLALYVQFAPLLRIFFRASCNYSLFFFFQVCTSLSNAVTGWCSIIPRTPARCSLQESFLRSHRSSTSLRAVSSLLPPCYAVTYYSSALRVRCTVQLKRVVLLCNFTELSTADVLRAVVSAHAVEPITLLLHPRHVEDLRLNCAVILRIVLSDCT